MTKKTCKISLILLLFIVIVTGLFAIKPEWHSGMLLLNAESGYGQTYTGYWAIVGGVETWLSKYEWYIGMYRIYGENYSTTLPPDYVYAPLTAERLANLIWNDIELELYYVPSKVVNKIKEALQLDRRIYTEYGILAAAENFLWDPYNAWKWRSVYMEGRYADNNRTDVSPNCWGTADYLTKSTAWVVSLNYYHQFHFPYIWMDAPEITPYSIDTDLKNYYYFHLEGTGNVSGGLKRVINSFDIIRFGTDPAISRYKEDMNYFGTNLGTNNHSAVYLCTDVNDKPWFFHKSGPRAPFYEPYDIYALDLNDPNPPSYWKYEDDFRTYFRHDGDIKQNLADSFDINWGGVQ